MLFPLRCFVRVNFIYRPVPEKSQLVKLINTIQASPEWGTTAIIVMYDDSDGWYDHQMGPIVNQSTGTAHVNPSLLSHLGRWRTSLTTPWPIRVPFSASSKTSG